MKKIILFILLLFIPFLINAEEINMEWQKEYEDIQALKFIFKTNNDDFIISGRNGTQGVISRIDKDGNRKWKFEIEGYYRAGTIYSTIELENGDFFSVGFKVPTASPTAILIKYDKDGNVIFEKNWEHEQFFSMKKIDEEKYIVLGTQKIYVFDKEGNTISEILINDVTPMNMVLSNNNEIVIVGYKKAENLINDAVIVKYDLEGNLLWQKSWGGTKDDHFESLISTENGYIVIGTFYSTDIEGLVNKGDVDSIIIKYDLEGNVVWQKTYGQEEYDTFEKIIIDNNNNYIVLGNNSGNGVILVYDKNGNVLVEILKKFSSGLESLPIVITSNNEIIEVGTTNSVSKIEKYTINYTFNNITQSTNGTPSIEQKGSLGVITPNPNEGYKVEKIIIKDKEGNVLDVEVTEQEDGTFTFPLYTDVSIEVIYELAIDNPKTGILDVVTILIIGFLMSITGFFIVKNYSERLEI